MNIRFIVTVTALLCVTATNLGLAAEIPYTITYAHYRQRLISKGWKPDTAKGCNIGIYKEACGNQVGAGYWIHPVSRQKIGITLWQCEHGWCVGALLTKD